MTYSVYVTTVNNNVHCVRSHMRHDDAMHEYMCCVNALQNDCPVYIKDPDSDSQTCVSSRYIVEIAIEDEDATADMVQKLMDSMEAD